MRVPILSILVLQAASKVVQVQIVHRHGDRVPSVGYSIPTNWVDWTQPPPKGLGLGLGQLTGLGMSQGYALGKWLRDTYITNEGLLTTDYRFEDVLVWSTNVDRTLATAQSVLMGLYPNGTSQSTWNDMTGTWGLPTGAQPIPIHTADKWDYLFQAVDICPEYDMRVQAYFQSKEWKDKKNEYSSFFTWFKEKTGFNWATLEDFYNFYDPVMVSKVHNKLTIQSIKDRWSEVQATVDWIEWKKRSLGGKLIASPLLGQIYYESEMAMFGNNTKHKFVEYSAHDSTLMALAVTAGFDSNPKFQKLSGYTAAYVFELNNDTSTGALTMVVKFRDPDGTITQIASYKWQEWFWFIGNHTFPNTASWCIACNNTGVGGGYPGAGPCYRTLEYFNDSTWTPEEPWEPPATDMPTPGVAPTEAMVPTPEPTPMPSNPGDPPTSSPPSSPPSSSPPSSGPPTAAGAPTMSDPVMEQLKQTVADRTATISNQNTLIVVLSVLLGLMVIVATFLFCRVRSLKSSSLQTIQQYQGLN